MRDADRSESARVAVGRTYRFALTRSHNYDLRKLVGIFQNFPVFFVGQAFYLCALDLTRREEVMPHLIASHSRRTALVFAVHFALLPAMARGDESFPPERFPAFVDGHFVPTPDGAEHHDGSQLAADAHAAAATWCAANASDVDCRFLSHAVKEIPGQPGRGSARSVLEITVELSLQNGPQQKIIDGDIDIVRSCPVDAVLVNDAGGELENRDRWSSIVAVACVSPDELPKPDALGTPEESGANHCPVGNSPLVGNPINPLTFSKIEHVVDYVGPTSSGLTFARTYHSGAFPLGFLSRKIGARYIAGARIGARWRHTFDRAFVSRPYHEPEANAYTMALYLVHHDGRETRFVKSGDRFVPVEGERGTLREHPEGGWMYTWPDLTVERYNDRGRLQSRTDANGNVLTLHYDDITVGIGVKATVLTRVIDRQGRELRLGYDRLGRIETVDTPDGRINYSYNGGILDGLDADLVQVAYPDGKTVKYLYDEPDMGGTPNHKLTGIVGKDGKRFATFHYYNDNRARRSSHGNDLEWTEVVAVNDSLRIESKDRDWPEEWWTTYDHGRARLGKRARSDYYAESAFRNFEYLGGGLVGRQTDYLGVPTSYRYDRSRQLEIERTEAEGTPVARTIKTIWHATFDKPTRIDDGTHWVTLEYDAKGNLLEAREGGLADAAHPGSGPWPEERVTLYGYDVAGRILTVDGPLPGGDDTTRYAYYPSDASGCDTTACDWRLGDLHTVTNGQGHVATVLSYDSAGRVRSSTDPNGVRTDRRYDASGRPIEVTMRARRDGTPSTEDSVTRLTYTANGDLEAVTDADGASVTGAYDEARRLVSLTDSLGNRRELSWNGYGCLIEERQADHQGNEAMRRQFSYDAVGVLTSTTYPGIGGRDYTYDDNGRLTGIEDDYAPLGVIKATYKRDARGRIHRIKLGEKAIGQWSQIDLVYDGSDRLKSVVDPKGLTTEYLRNGLGDLLWQRSPDTGETRFDNDPNGQPVDEMPADDRTVKRTYDRLGRLTTATFQDGQTTTYKYDMPEAQCAGLENFPIGRLSSVSEVSGSTALCYDFAGHITRKIQSARGVSLVVRYVYSPAGRLLASIYPDGHEVYYTRNAAGQVTQIDTKAPFGQRELVISNVTYDAMGRVTSWTAGERTVRRQYDAMGNATQLDDGTIDGLSALLTYAGFGTLTSIKTRDDNASRTVWIDSMSRVLKGGPLNPGGQFALGEDYTYDNTGNRIKWSSLLTTRKYTYAPDNHRLLVADNLTREYDAAGNTTRIGSREFVYDATGRVSQVKVNGVSK
ncbi:hypothetical protein [Luteibacter sp. Lutesp34]|uniref:hypothetical protein n=1 Tax=Luteibacter sp. Lutesp34 TaxID=3243030 RepID=UPI0039B39DDD